MSRRGARRDVCLRAARPSTCAQPSAEGTPMHCPHCQHENREGARFCAACGSSVAWKCPACGSEPPPGAAFCDHCGTPLTATAATPPSLAPRPQTLQAYTPAHLAEKILTSKTALEGERKQVTVLFADLKGSTELIEGLDPEEARPAPGPGAARHDGRRAPLRGHREPGARGRHHGALRGSHGPRGSRRAGLLRRHGHAGGHAALRR